MEKESESSQVLQELLGATDKAMATLEARAAAAADIESQFADIQDKFEKAAEIKDKQERNLRMKVLTATLEELRKDASKEEQDLAQAVFGLNAMLENMGAEYQGLTKFNNQETQLIKEAERQLAQAEAHRRQAEGKWFFKESAVATAAVELQNAKQRLDEAKSEAKRLARQRLLNADMDTSLQEFMLRVEKTIQIMQRRMGEIEAQLKIVSARKEKAFEITEQAARALEQLDQTLTQKEEELRREEEMLQGLENGSPEYAAQTKKISDLRAEVELLRGRRNTAFVLHQSKEKFSAELEIHEKTQLKLRDNQRMWITSLRSDTEERVVTFRSRLEAMKAASDQDIAKNLDDLGAEADQRNAEYMAQVGAASDRIRMDKIEKHPQRLTQIAKVAAAQAEAVQRIRAREQKAIEEFKRLYGIDPTESSFFHYVEKGETPEEEESETSGSGVF